MTYPPGSPGYPPAQSPGAYGASSPSVTKSDDGESNLKLYLTVGVVALGLATYLLSYGPMITRILPNGDELIESGSTLPIDLGIAGGAAGRRELVAQGQELRRGGGGDRRAGRAAAGRGHHRRVRPGLGAVVRAGLRSAPGHPRGQCPLAGCGRHQPTGATSEVRPVRALRAVRRLLRAAGYHQQSPQQSGYGSAYGGYPSGPSTGGFSAVGQQSGPIPAPQSGPQHGSPDAQHQGSPTPPTGFPSFNPPPSSGSGGPGQGNSANHAGSGQGQHAYGQGQQPQAPSSPSGPSQS